METLKFAPNGFLTWMMERDKRPAIARLRENRTYVHEVATKLIEEKRREPKDGASQKDLLSLLGSPCVVSLMIDTWTNIPSSSQGKLRRPTRFTADR